MEQGSWLAKNLAAIRQRIHWLYDEPDGTIFFEPSGVHFIRIDKIKSHIVLALLEQVNLTSNLGQSRLELDEPLYLAAPYSQAALLGLVWNNTPKRMYLAGFGGGRIPLVLHHYFSKAIIECTEIDPNIIEAATRFFGVKLDERLTVAIADGREYLACCSPDIQYDLIFTDVVLGNGYMPYRMTNQEFYELCKNHLSESGVVVVNLLRSYPFYAEKLKTIQSVFEHVYLCPVEGGNTVVFGTKGPGIDKEEVIERSQFIQDYYQFSFSLVEKAREVKIASEFSEYVPSLKDAKILTDTLPPPGYFENLPSFNTFFAQVGSNDPCPCGSGKQFQDCHENSSLTINH